MKRGRNIENREWDTRTKRIASMIPREFSVLDFGAGRRVLERHLAEGQIYTPCDIESRGPDTIVCDLNAAELPEFPPHHAAVFGGVLEYVEDVPRLLAHLPVLFVYASYAIVETNPENRRERGWVNDFSFDDLETVFTDGGFYFAYCLPWKEQLLFTFFRPENWNDVDHRRRKMD